MASSYMLITYFDHICLPLPSPIPSHLNYIFPLPWLAPLLSSYTSAPAPFLMALVSFIRVAHQSKAPLEPFEGLG